jgi:hypothetical protein
MARITLGFICVVCATVSLGVAAQDVVFLFPPVPWEEATRGVVGLSVGTEDAPAAEKLVMAPGFAARAEPAVLTSLRARYSPLVGEAAAGEYDRRFGADERQAVARGPKSLRALAGRLREEAIALPADRLELRRILTVRSFALARRGGAPFAILHELGQDARRLLTGETPAVLAQRTEVDSGLADAALAEGVAGPAATQALAAAARANVELALWQFNRNYLEQAASALARAERHAKAGRLEDLTRACTAVRTALDARRALRDRWVPLAKAAAERPEDPAANAALARFLLIEFRDVEGAVGPAAKSGDVNLEALARAAQTGGAAERAAALGVAIVPLVDAARDARERAVLAKVAAGQLERYLRASSLPDLTQTRARFALSRVEGLATGAPPDVAAVAAEAAGDAGAAVPLAVGPVVLDPPERVIVFVVDASGSMTRHMPGMVETVTRMADGLKRWQRFNCLVLHDDAHRAMSADAVAADDAGKAALARFLGPIAPRGASDAVPALRAAFAGGPEVIQILTDGDFPDRPAVEAEVRRLNAARRTAVNTLGFGDREAQHEALLKRLAAEAGGTYRHVAE